jgi:hypothetical protein
LQKGDKKMRFYCIDVLTEGKYHNVVTGRRYVITKREAKTLIEELIECECEIKIYELVRNGGVFMWGKSLDLKN